MQATLLIFCFFIGATYPALEAKLEQRADYDEDVVDADEHVPQVAELKLVPHTQFMMVVDAKEPTARLSTKWSLPHLMTDQYPNNSVIMYQCDPNFN